MSNFDVFNETEHHAHGAEIELEGIHIEDLGHTFPSHFDNESVSEYVDGSLFGTRSWSTAATISRRPARADVGQSTNGHTRQHGRSALWILYNCKSTHRRPLLLARPEWTAYRRTDGCAHSDLDLLSSCPIPAHAPVLRAEVEPIEFEAQQPDSLWMGKVFKIEIERPVELAELMSGNGIVPEGVDETETEWELLKAARRRRPKTMYPMERSR